MKSLINLGLFILISLSLITTVNASTVTTTTTTVTTTKYGCGTKHHKKHYKKVYSNECYRDRVYYIDYSFSADYARYQGDYDPYACVESDNPASCSGPQRDYPDSCFQCGS